MIIMSSVWTVRLFSFTPLEWQRARRDKKRFLFFLLLWLTPLFTRGSAPLLRATPITLKRIRDCLRSKLNTTKSISGISCFPHLRVSSVVEVVVVSKSKAISGCKNLKSEDFSRSLSSVWLNSFFSQDILAYENSRFSSLLTNREGRLRLSNRNSILMT